MRKFYMITIFLFCMTFNIFAADFDVAVIGTDPEGIAAAVSSARNGMRTLLIDTRDKVGGLFTLGGLNSLDMNYSLDGTLLTQGIFEEFFLAIHPENAFAGFWDKRDSFDIATAEKIFLSMIAAEDNITLILNADDILPAVTENKITHITANNTTFTANVFIDATQDADIAAAAGVPYTIGGMDINNPTQIQAITQVFKIDNVDWAALRDGIYSDTAYYQAEMNAYSAWGFLDIMRAYTPAYPDNVKVRGLNVGLQNDNSVLINAMQLIGFDPLNQSELSAAKNIAADECEHIAAYIIANIPGFANATYGGITEELYVRESRHIIGEYTLSASDMMSHMNFSDKIAWGSYPIDIQTTSIDNWGYIIGDPDAYSIPFRSIIPKVIDNLLIASRSASYHSIGFGSVRVVPIGMAIGEAAGVAAAYAVNTNATFRDFAYNSSMISQIQQQLIAQGAFLADLDLPYAYEGHPFSNGISYAYNAGIIIGSYNNDIHLNDLAAAPDVIEAFHKFIRIEEISMPLNEAYLQNEYVTTIQLVFAIFEMLSIADTNIDKRIVLHDAGIISEQLFHNMNNQVMITYSDLYQALYEISQYLKTA
ncbi:FAD-dependent oxidoreductase [Candidatus Epulonipiscium viviparus]|uniref:FAD-dependent oxidoreductase n=1 Tax=Candidatus Epulonipiscium viviparus TaxID=420336 RepID=UPI00068E266C|nr:FAD-dependent oxidoreductase [Candidatus Epulopiscium viviparus]